MTLLCAFISRNTFILLAIVRNTVIMLASTNAMEQRKMYIGTAVSHQGMFIPQVGDGIILTMPQGGPIQYKDKSSAVHHADCYLKGHQGGAYPALKEDVI